jgi:DNA invertase Pin-like site-specific DNA recombinase
MKPAIGYIRVSTARQGRSGLGLEAQQAALAKFCDAEAFKLVETYTDRERR